MGSGSKEFERLTRRHAIKLVPTVNCSVEEASMAVGKVMCLSNADQVSEVVETGIVIQDTFTPVLPLVTPVRKITISNIPLFSKK